jgi:methyl coenzyme M reductase subunit D
MRNGNPTVSKIDRIEVLLTWASEKAPEIKDDLSSYSKDAYKVRASDILQRAKSIENLAELGLSKNRFLPNYIEFTDSLMELVKEARNLVINNYLDVADELVRDLFSEWRQVSKAYANDPFGSESGYSKDEIKRIEYRKHLEKISETVSKFYNAGFAQHSDKYVKMTDEVSELIDYGNFIDAESKLSEIRTYLNEYLPLNNANIIYDIEYDQEKNIWIIEGAVNKPDGLRKKDMRQDLYVTVYDGAGNIHSSLEFTDTRNGDFFTQWRAPTEPGLYVVMLQYMNSKATQIVNVADKNERNYDSEELDTLELAREFEELNSFIEQFGGENYNSNSKFEYILHEIKIGLVNRDSKQVDAKLDELKRLIERYLPMRSQSAVIEAQFDNDKLTLSGAVYKTLSFSEDLFIDIFDQRGNLVNEVALKDGTSGHFSKVISQPFSPGVYVAQLGYHDLTVTDFFSVN